MSKVALILKIVEKLSESISRAVTAKKINDRRNEDKKIKENPDEHQTDLFGESSGRVSVHQQSKPDD